MASYRKRGDRWYCEVRKRGVYRSGTFRTKTAARRWSEDVEREIEEGRPRGAHTLAEAMRRYAETVSVNKGGWRREQQMLAAFEHSMPFAMWAIEDVTPAVIADWRDSRLERVKPASVRRELTILTACMEHARREWRWLAGNPCRDVKKPGSGAARDQLIPDVQRDQLYDKAAYVRGQPPITMRQHVCAALDFSLETAMRAGEIRALTGEHIHVAERYVHLPTSKTGQARNVPLSKAAVEILSSLDPEKPFPMNDRQLDANFRKLKKLCGLQDAFTFHDARATAITRLSKRVPIEMLARISGHTNLNQLKDYYREHASEMAKLLDD